MKITRSFWNFIELEIVYFTLILCSFNLKPNISDRNPDSAESITSFVMAYKYGLAERPSIWKGLSISWNKNNIKTVTNLKKNRIEICFLPWVNQLLVSVHYWQQKALPSSKNSVQFEGVSWFVPLLKLKGYD